MRRGELRHVDGRVREVGIGGVQVGWFENPHNAAQGYEKNASFSIISPQDFDSAGDSTRASSYVGERRFEAEIDKVKEFLEKNALVQLPETDENKVAEDLAHAFTELLRDTGKRAELAKNALEVMRKNRGATTKTIENLKQFLG